MAEGKQSRFDLIINAVERVSGPFRRIEQAMDGVRDRTEKARQALGRFSRVTGLQRLSGSIGNVRDKLQGMVRGAGASGRSGGAPVPAVRRCRWGRLRSGHRSCHGSRRGQ